MNFEEDPSFVFDKSEVFQENTLPLVDRVAMLECIVNKLVKKNKVLKERVKVLEERGESSDAGTARAPGYHPRLAISTLVSSDTNSPQFNSPSPIKYRVYIGEPHYSHFYVVKMETSVNA